MYPDAEENERDEARKISYVLCKSIAKPQDGSFLMPLPHEYE